MTKRVVILGASGYIGYFLNNYLMRQMEKDERCYSIWRVSKSGTNGCHKLNIENGDTLKNFMDYVKPDIVFHLAGESSSRATPNDLFRSNVLGTFNVCKAVPKKCQLIFTSSSMVYGDNYMLRCKVEKNKNVFDTFMTDKEVEEACFAKEGDAFLPKTDYGCSKAAAEKFVEHYAGTCCRIPGQIGPMMTKGLIRDIIWKAKTQPKIHVRGTKSGGFLQFNYVTDTVRQLYRISQTHSSYETINISTSKGMTVKQIVELIQKQLGTSKKVVWEDTEQNRYCKMDVEMGKTYGPFDYPTTESAIIQAVKDFGKEKTYFGA